MSRHQGVRQELGRGRGGGSQRVHRGDSEKVISGELAKKVVARRAAAKGFIKEIVAGKVAAEEIDEEVAVKAADT